MSEEYTCTYYTGTANTVPQLHPEAEQPEREGLHLFSLKKIATPRKRARVLHR